MATTRRTARIRDVAAARQAGLTVVLEDVHDPHNIAAILRSCDSFGVQQVHLIFDKEEAYDPRFVGKSSSSSANKWLDFQVHASSRDCFAHLHSEGYTILSSSLDSQAAPLHEVDFLSWPAVALVFGNEHDGLSRYCLEHADRLIRVPMAGMIQSLNVSVTVAVCLWEVTRQRQDSGQRWTVSDAEAARLMRDFEDR